MRGGGIIMKPNHGMSRTLAASLLLQLAGSQAAFAQQDPPERVARLNFVQGAVSFLPSGGTQDDWVDAVVNRPLTTGDRLWADTNSRAELHLGPNAVRIDSNTGISFLNLDDAAVQIRLSDGSVIIRLRRLDPGDSFEVDTPNLAIPIRRPGDYRIDTHPDRNLTVVTVRQGEGEAIGGGRSWQIISDQQAVFTGTDALDYDLRDADSQAQTDFDKWAAKRDERENRVASVRYVSTDMTGYEDLDAYGMWQNVPSYGWCWFPAGVQAGWAPYRYGHWIWISPWGWTWVEDEPWGFAPFHYGRWAYWRTGWMWVPGPIVPRPCYAPALVAWVGGGGVSFSFSVGGGRGVGWIPLGPREIYVPPYRVSERYVTQVNVTNTIVNRTTVINVYQNRSVKNVTFVNRAAPNGVTVVQHDTFVGARPVMRNMIQVPPGELAAAPVVREISATPERASVVGAGSRNAPHPPASVANRPVVVSRTPPPEPNHFAPIQNQPANRPPSRPERSVGTARSAAAAQSGQPPDRPIVKPAPAVRNATPQERANIQTKQKAWENAHPRDNARQGRDGGQKPGKPPKHQ